MKTAQKCRKEQPGGKVSQRVNESVGQRPGALAPGSKFRPLGLRVKMKITKRTQTPVPTGEDLKHRNQKITKRSQRAKGGQKETAVPANPRFEKLPNEPIALGGVQGFEFDVQGFRSSRLCVSAVI